MKQANELRRLRAIRERRDQSRMRRGLTLASILFMDALTGSAATREASSHRWKLLAPLPDRVGFAGMFGGVLNDRLVAGGGSQFPEKPLWLKGERAFSDRIVTLSSLDGKWVEHSARLPIQMANFACATPRDASYVVGRRSARGCLRQGWEIPADERAFAS